MQVTADSLRTGVMSFALGIRRGCCQEQRRDKGPGLPDPAAGITSPCPLTRLPQCLATATTALNTEAVTRGPGGRASALVSRAAGVTVTTTQRHKPAAIGNMYVNECGCVSIKLYF